MGLRVGLDWCGKSLPTEIRSPDRPARKQSNLVIILLENNTLQQLYCTYVLLVFVSLYTFSWFVVQYYLLLLLRLALLLVIKIELIACVQSSFRHQSR